MTDAAPPVSLRRNIAANYLGRAYSMGANYLFIPFYVAILGVEAYGVIAFYAVLLTITGLADVGLSATFSREAARQQDPAQLIRLLATAERILLAAAAGCALVIFLGAGWFAEHWLNSTDALGTAAMVWPLRLMALMLVPQLLIALYSAGLLGLQRQVKANGIQAAFITVRAGLVILPILWRPDLTLFFGWQLAATLAFAVITRMALVRAMGLGSFATARFDYAALRPHLHYAGGMLAIIIISTVNTQLDKLIVSNLFSIAEFGYYSLASALAQIPPAISTPVAVALFPSLTANIAQGRADLERAHYQHYGAIISFLAALSAVGLALFSRELTAIWLPRTDLPASFETVVSVLALGSLFLCLQMPSYYLSLAHGSYKIVVVFASITLAFSVPLTIYLTSQYGVVGAAAPWLILNVTNFGMLCYLINRRYYAGSHLNWLWRYSLGPAATAATPLVAARFIADRAETGVIANCIIAAIAAACACAAFGTFAMGRARTAS